MHPVIVQCELVYCVTAPTSFVFNVASARTDHQKAKQETVRISPDIAYEWCSLQDGYTSIRLQAEPTTLTLQYDAHVTLNAETGPASQLDEVQHQALPSEVLPYLNPSRYCESDRLLRFAAKEFTALSGGYSRVNAICDWVNAHLDYVSGSTTASTSACDVLVQRAGVCRDFAHVGIALCRALGIPARYVSGYAVGLEPPDFHGFFEAYLGDGWYLFDATRMAAPSGLVRIGMGRDAADAAFASFVGTSSLSSIRVSAVSGGPNTAADAGTDTPVSTA